MVLPPWVIKLSEGSSVKASAVPVRLFNIGNYHLDQAPCIRSSTENASVRPVSDNGRNEKL